MNTLQPATGYMAAFYPIFASESPLGATCLHCKEVVDSNKLMLYDDKNQTDDFKLLACSFSCIDALEIEQERRLEQRRRIEQYLLTECFCRPWIQEETCDKCALPKGDWRRADWFYSRAHAIDWKPEICPNPPLDSEEGLMEFNADKAIAETMAQGA